MANNKGGEPAGTGPASFEDMLNQNSGANFFDLSDELLDEYLNILKKKEKLQFLSAQKQNASDDELKELNQEYADFNRELNKDMLQWVYKKQFEEETKFNDQIEAAKKANNYKLANEHQVKLNEYKAGDNYVDFSKWTKVQKGTIAPGLVEPGAETGLLDDLVMFIGGETAEKYYYDDAVDVTPEALTSAFTSYADDYVKKEKEQPQEVPQNTGSPDGNGGVSITSDGSGNITVPKTTKTTVNPNDMEEAEYETKIQQKQEGQKRDVLPTEIDGPIERSQWEYDDGIGLGDYLLPAGQALSGMIAATQPLPDPSMSPEMRTMIDEDMSRRNQGLTPDEIDYRNRQAERGYAYDVKNIANMSGGSAGMALANLGRAQETLQGQYSQTAVADEQMRRINQENARRAADKAENYERYEFGIDYKEALMDAEAGAQLASAGFENLKDVTKYKRQYGEGTFYGKRMEQLVRQTEDQENFAEAARKNFLKLQEQKVTGTTNQQTNNQTNNQTTTQTAQKSNKINIVKDINVPTEENQVTSMNDLVSEGTQEVDLTGLKNEPGTALLETPINEPAPKQEEVSNVEQQESSNEEEVLENAPKGSYKKDDTTYVMDGVAYDINEDDNGRFVNVNGKKQYLKKKVNSKAPFVGESVGNTDYLSQLKDNEGFRAKKYTDTTGNETIGYGHKIDKEEKKSGKIYGIDYTDGLTEKESEIILQKDYESAKKYTNQLLNNYDIDANNLSESQYKAIQEMVYQLGGAGAGKFKKTFALIKEGKYSEAAKEVQNSEWYKQTPKRVKQFQDNIVKSNK